MTSTSPASLNGLPFLPGFSVDVEPRQDWRKRSMFELREGVVVDSTSRCNQTQLSPQHSNLLCPLVVDKPDGRSRDSLHPLLSNSEYTMQTLPTWIAYDNKVMRFFAYFRQAVHESAIETHRIRVCEILFFLQDGTIAIMEKHEDNSGMDAGVLLRRQRVSDPNGGYIGIDHFRVRQDITLYERVYHIFDADKHTRDSFESIHNVQLAASEPVPLDQFHASKAAAAASRVLPDDFEPVSAHFEAVHGKLQRKQLQRFRKFLERDGEVLRFWAIWRNPFLHGEVRPLVLHYFLADDTVEVLEIVQPNSGRYPFPTMLKRQKLRKDMGEFGTDHIGDDGENNCYTDKDLQCGATVRVFGRDIMLLRCDANTTQYYRKHHNVDQIPVDEKAMLGDDSHSEKISDIPCEMKKDARHKQFEDDLIDCKNRRKALTRDQERNLFPNIYRFQASMISMRPEDEAREFVITFFEIDENVTVFEKPLRNSGFLAGTFLERSIGYNHEEKRVFQKSDFVVGNQIHINGFVFRLLDCDATTKKLLAHEKVAIKHLDLKQVENGLRALLQSKNVTLRKTFRVFDTKKEGFWSVDDFALLLDTYGWVLPKEQVQTMFDKYDSDGDGRISFVEFAMEVEQRHKNEGEQDVDESEKSGCGWL